MKKSGWILASWVLLLLHVAALAGTDIITVETERGGCVRLGNSHSGCVNANGALYWDGNKWDVNTTYGHMYFGDKATGEKLKDFTTTVVEYSSGGNDVQVAEVAGPAGRLYRVTHSTYTYTKTADGRIYRVEAAEFRVGMVDQVTKQSLGPEVMLRSRSAYMMTGTAYFDVYIQNENGTWEAFRGDPVWFGYPASMSREQVLAATSPTDYRRGDLPSAGANYWLDIDGGSEMGGKTYKLITSTLNPQWSLGAGLGSSLTERFALQYSDSAGTLREILAHPYVYSVIDQTNDETTLLDADYAGQGRADQALDLYIPAGPGPFPLLIHIHGGGWRSGEKGGGQSVSQVRARMHAMGYAFATINYRLSGAAQWPAQIQDCQAAVRWLRANAAQYRLDPDRFAAWGTSAGGHLAAMLAVASDVPEFEDAALGNAGVSSRVQAVVDWYGPTNLLTMDDDGSPACENPMQHDAPGSPETLMLGCTPSGCPARAQAASPISYVTPDDPPFLIMHGTNDCTVPTEQSRRMAEALLTGWVKCALRSVGGEGHGGPGFNAAETAQVMDDFLERVFRTDPPVVTSAADYNFISTAPGQALSIFGAGFSDGFQAAGSAELPTELDGVSVEVTGADEVLRLAGVYFVSSGQANFLLPPEIADGPVEVRLRKNGGILQHDRVQLRTRAPTLFTADSTGAHWAAGLAKYSDFSWHFLAAWNAADSRWDPLTVQLTAGVAPVYLELYGTGLGNGTTAETRAWIGDQPAMVLYAGHHSLYPGLDQYNLEIPSSLAGRSEVSVTISVDGITANPVRVRIE